VSGKRVYGILELHVSLANVTIFSYFLTRVVLEIHFIKTSRNCLLILHYHYSANDVPVNNFNKLKTDVYNFW